MSVWAIPIIPYSYNLGNKTAANSTKKDVAGFQQYSALVNIPPAKNNRPAQGPDGQRGRILPAVPISSSPSPFKPIHPPSHQNNSTKNMVGGTPTSKQTYHANSSSNIIANPAAVTKNNAPMNQTKQHNYNNSLPAKQPQHPPAYANITTTTAAAMNSTCSRPNSTTSFAEIQYAKQKQQQLEQQKRRESTGSGRLLDENNTSSRLVSHAMSEMIQSHSYNNSNTNITAHHAQSSSQASLASSSPTGIQLQCNRFC